MKKLITTCAALLVVLAASAAYSSPWDDNFDDNSMNTSIWNLYQENSNVGLNETNDRLEVISNMDTAGAPVFYLANGWGISTADDDYPHL